MRRCTLLSLFCLALAACAGGAKRDDAPDGAPDRKISADRVLDAVPRAEPRSRFGNGPTYQVLGRTYQVLPSAAGYVERGYASWYGRKFHGRRTSSGEIFDMYLATAAHRTLPLPTYAEVTNLANGRKVIVKINDRGPFHSDRIIDLSYGAAVKIGIYERGTGRVEVRAIALADDFRLPDDTYLQAGAFRSKSAARELARNLERADVEPVDLHKSRGLYKVWIGPIEKNSDLDTLARRVVELGFERPHRVRR